MIALVFLLLFSMGISAGEMAAVWTLPEHRKNGEVFIPGELLSTRIVYSRQGGSTEHEMDISVPASSVRISGLKKGWWNVHLRSVSKCYLAGRGLPASYDFMSETLCVSDPTPTLRVKIR